MNKQGKIVLVDDDETIVELLQYWFRHQGFETMNFSSGTPVLPYLHQHQEEISLVILDRLLPDMDGIELLDGIPEHVPVLILSVLGSDKDVLEGIRRGAVDYMPKPFNVDILVEKSKSLMFKNHV